MPEITTEKPVIAYTLAELLNVEFPELTWWVDRLITSGLTLVWGSSKVGKSILTLHLLLAIVQGGRALGHLRCIKADVLLISLEDGARRLQSRLKTAAAPPLEGFHIFTAWPRGNEGIERLALFLDEHPGVKVVVLDTLFLFARIVDGNDYGTTVPVMERIKSVADSRDVSIIAIHHSKKPSKETAGDMVNTALGSTGLVAGPDHLIYLQRTPTGPAEAVLHFKSKDADTAEMALRFNPDIGGWEYIGDAAEMAETDQRQDILDVLRDNGEAMTTGDVAKRLKKSDSSVSKLLAKLADSGKVRKLSYGLWMIETPAETGKTGKSRKTSAEEPDPGTDTFPTFPSFPGSDGSGGATPKDSPDSLLSSLFSAGDEIEAAQEDTEQEDSHELEIW